MKSGRTNIQKKKQIEEKKKLSKNRNLFFLLIFILLWIFILLHLKKFIPRFFLFFLLNHKFRRLTWDYFIFLDFFIKLFLILSFNI